MNRRNTQTLTSSSAGMLRLSGGMWFKGHIVLECFVLIGVSCWFWRPVWLPLDILSMCCHLAKEARNGIEIKRGTGTLTRTEQEARMSQLGGFAIDLGLGGDLQWFTFAMTVHFTQISLRVEHQIRADGTPTGRWGSRFCSLQVGNKTLSSSNQRFNRFCKQQKHLHPH